jgi:hypothetical protein
MPVLPPIRSSASRELKRPQPMPAKLREAICLMVYGHPDDIDCRALSFIEAAQETRIKPDVMRRYLDRPDVMRRYLDRPDVRALLLAERRAFRAAVCGGNEGALLRVRETAQNGMAVVAAVRALEELENPRQGSGVTVNVGVRQDIRPGYVIRLQASDTQPERIIQRQPATAVDGQAEHQYASPVDPVDRADPADRVD